MSVDLIELVEIDLDEALDECGPLVSRLGPEAQSLMAEAISGDPGQCLQQVIEWIRSGTLDDEFRANPQRVVGTILCVLAGGLESISEYLLKTPDDPVPVFGDPAHSSTADRVRATLGSLRATGATGAIGLQPLGSIGWVALVRFVLPLILRYLRRYLSEHLESQG